VILAVVFSFARAMDPDSFGVICPNFSLLNEKRVMHILKKSPDSFLKNLLKNEGMRSTLPTQHAHISAK
jgi:hypothetical protein